MEVSGVRSVAVCVETRGASAGLWHGRGHR